MPDSIYQNIKPFFSVVLAELKAADVADQDVPAAPNLVEQLLEGMKSHIRADPETPIRSVQSGVVTEYDEGRAAYCGLRFKRETVPAWSTDERVKNTEFHLVLIYVSGRQAIVYVSDAKLKNTLSKHLRAGQGLGNVAELCLTPGGKINSVFVDGGPTRTLWLSGTHRRSEIKADSKVLSGLDLEYALDPFDDQTFFFTAARCRHNDLDSVIGLSPDQGRIWIKGTKSIEDFAAQSRLVIMALSADRDMTAIPFRYLAIPLNSLDGQSVHSAYDLSLLPPDTYHPEEDRQEELQDYAQKVYDTYFDITGVHANDPSCSFELRKGDQTLASGTLVVELSATASAKFTLEDLQWTEDAYSTEYQQVLDDLVDGHAINIRYDSGHSVSRKRVFGASLKRIEFDQFSAANFQNYNIKAEKPSSLDRIGTEDSLFCWMVHNYPNGWLVCDDGAMEKADFIHFDPAQNPPLLEFIHVKGAKSAQPGRGISVSAFEVVVGQAVKNLRWFDREGLIEGLEQRVREDNQFWFNGNAATRAAFMSEIERHLGGNVTRRVTILQPHLSLATRNRVINGGNEADLLRLDQLNILLAAADRTARGLGAHFGVICDS
ncbi:hypothetical protein MACH10_00170 [Thalassospira tepidiphila]|uniref:hypothetical protein n=1 Tax=Thalassospira tepidiphila TaxID=393657 RepID=UPI002925CF30|nr:hypothetical protein MACH10_00170 [Thalassospira tepidiphila]